jgi:lipoprotein-anchoring transpeptidase ErfK/SrfK
MVDIGVSSTGLFDRSKPHSDRLVIKIDKALQGKSRTAQKMFVYLDGRRIYKWSVSTGREQHERTPTGESTWTHTPTGTFRIYYRNIDHVSQLWDGVPMPYAQFFSGGVAIHAALPKYIPYLGSRASGGCIRLHPENARILWDLVSEVGTQNVLIEVYERGRFGGL